MEHDTVVFLGTISISILIGMMLGLLMERSIIHVEETQDSYHMYECQSGFNLVNGSLSCIRDEELTDRGVFSYKIEAKKVCVNNCGR